MTPFVSIDLETSGLDPSYCQILEVGIVVQGEDWTMPVDKLPYTSFLVDHKVITGEPYALAMNAEIIREIANKDSELDKVHPDDVVDYMLNFLSIWLPTRKVGQYQNLPEKFTIVGKNASSFDLVFLGKFPGWSSSLYHHRILDVGPLYFDPFVDKCLPDTKTCMQRAGVSNERPHRALDDARCCIEMIRAKYTGKVA